MPQIRKVDDDALIDRLTQTFKDVGFEGASLSILSDATGLKKSSLYHRFPNGKAQMAEEVLNRVRLTLDADVFPVLEGPLPPAEKMAFFIRAVDGLYANGTESCLLNMLCPPRGHETVSGQAINGTFHRLREALAFVAAEMGASKDEASTRAEQVLVEIQGALVVARGLNDVTVFSRMLARLPGLILAHE